MVSVVLTFPLDFGHTNIKYNTKTTEYVLVIKSKARLKSLKQWKTERLGCLQDLTNFSIFHEKQNMIKM